MASDAPHRPLHRHPAPHRELWRRYRAHFPHPDFRVSFYGSLLFFAFSVVVSFLAIRYATERASNSVTDIVLSNVPALDVDGFFVFGTVLLIAYVTFVLFAHPKRVPFALNTLSFFYLVRSAFVTLTHIGPFSIVPDSAGWGDLASSFLFGSDLFFSAHTGVPFLFALIFWRERGLRNVFLAWSVYMATVVLLGHYHYSIDVASAFFITYTIFHIAVWLFPKSHARFLADDVRID